MAYHANSIEFAKGPILDAEVAKYCLLRQIRFTPTLIDLIRAYNTGDFIDIFSHDLRTVSLAHYSIAFLTVDGKFWVNNVCSISSTIDLCLNPPSIHHTFLILLTVLFSRQRRTHELSCGIYRAVFSTLRMLQDNV